VTDSRDDCSRAGCCSFSLLVMLLIAGRTEGTVQKLATSAADRASSLGCCVFHFVRAGTEIEGKEWSEEVKKKRGEREKKKAKNRDDKKKKVLLVFFLLLLLSPSSAFQGCCA